MDQEIVALIPVREGSQRVKNKNFRPFAKEKSLMHLKIRQLKEANCFDSIYVSSDSELAKEIAESEGINFLYRDPYMCGHESRLYEYNNYMLNTIPGNPVVAWTMVTAPLYQDYALAIEAYKNNSNEYDSLMSVIKYDDFLVDQNAKPINLLTQELREAYQLTGGIYMAPKDKQLEWSYWFGPKPYMHEISKIESMDVDDQQDFEICELFHLNKNGED